MTSYRLAAGGLVDRSRPLPFTFDGAKLSGLAGDSLASALLANGVRTVGRSFKYHRPRGILTAGSSEPNALVSLGTGGRREPNTRATTIELYEGLVAESQNRWPSLRFDAGALNNLLSPFLAAGFYYKTFMWPARFWEKLYEPLIRRAAGLGRGHYLPDPDHYEKRWAHCDLLVVGAGPSGLLAALTAARSGARVILADERERPGGSLLGERLDVGGMPGADWASRIVSELAAMPNVTVVLRTTVFGWYDSNVFGALEKVQKHTAHPDPNLPVERLWRIVARHAMLATGAEERPLTFGGNDRIGIMLAGAMRTYANRYSVAPGRRAAIFTSGDDAYRTAHDLVANGVEVAAIVDSRSDPAVGAPPGVRVIAGSVVVGTSGARGLASIDIVTDGRTERLAVDALAMSGGFSPVIHLACQRGARPIWNSSLNAFAAPPGLRGLSVAGAAAGVYSTGEGMRDGIIRAGEALEQLGFAAHPPSLPALEGEDGGARVAAALWHVGGSRGKAFVDFQNDVAVADLKVAVSEGYRHVELVKRYTTTGMATDQGKLSNVNAIGIVAEQLGRSPGEIGTTTFRPFYSPVSFGALAGEQTGRNFQPVRRSPLHGWAQDNGAVFVESGLWYRSAWFPRRDEKGWRESVDREARNVRRNVGVCDVSTLGKIEVFGPDAAQFLDRVYCNGFSTLPVGKARYGLMLREDGFVYDDGTASRLGADHFVVTTTTALAGGVMGHLEFCAQVLWPALDIRLASVSDQWAQMAIAGPSSRAVLERLVDTDLSDAEFPHLAAAQVLLRNGLEARLFRISFSGELAYELAVPAKFGNAIAGAVMEAGAPYGICAYGTEALGVLRIEKGHVTHAEINGTVTPADLGLGRMVSSKKDFVGRTMLRREGLAAHERQQLVGLKPAGADMRMRAGAHLLRLDDAPSTSNDQGYVTSSCYSPNLGHHIALALLRGGSTRYGEHLRVWNALHGETVEAVVCAPDFLADAPARELQ